MRDPKQSSNVDGFLSLPSSTQLVKKRSASYPAYTLYQSEELAKVVFELGARNCDLDRVAQNASYSVTSGAFRSLRAAANQFGLLQLGKNSYLSVSDEWIEAFHSEDSQLLKEARRRAIMRPKLYKQLVGEYSGRQLPTPEKLSRELHLNQKYGILKDAAETAARIFLESATYAGLLNEQGYLVNTIEVEQEATNEDVEASEFNVDTEEQNQSAEQSQREHSKKLNLGQSVTQSDNSLERTLPGLEELERHEIALINGKKAYLYVPVPLPYGEKERLKKYLSFISDLILEELPSSHSAQQTAKSTEKGLWASEE